MADIARFNPFRELTRFDPFGREIDDLFKGFFLTPVPLNQVSGGQIPLDVIGDDKSCKVRAETKTMAKYADGVLELVLPKKAAAATRTITID